MERAPTPGTVAYWAGAVVLVLFGFVAIFSIGAPFFLTGVAMLAVGPWRRNPAILWPVLVGVWLFVIAFILAAPLGCTSSAVAGAGTAAGEAVRVGHTTCTNVLGIDYSGEGTYNPSLLPAVLAGAVAAAAGAVAARLLLVGRRFAHK